MIASLEPEAPPSSLPLSSPRAPYAAIFADYDSCFDVVNPLIQDCPGTQKYSRAFFQHWGVLEKRDAAVSLLNRFLDEITRDRRAVYLFVGSNRQSLAFDKVLGSAPGGFEAIGGGAFEAIAKERGWTLNYALVADVGPVGLPRWSKDTEGSAWTDNTKRQPIEPRDGTTAAEDRRLKLMIVENNFRQLRPEQGEVDVYFFDDREEFLANARENANIPDHIQFYTCRWDFMGYIVDGWSAQSHPLVAKKAERRKA